MIGAVSAARSDRVCRCADRSSCLAGETSPAGPCAGPTRRGSPNNSRSPTSWPHSLGEPDDQAVSDLLPAVTRTRTPDGKAVVPIRPSTPLGASALLVNGHGQPNAGSELRKEIASADRIDLGYAPSSAGREWILERSWRSSSAGVAGELRVITTTYRGATERRALDRLTDLGRTSRSHTRPEPPACTPRRGCSAGSRAIQRRMSARRTCRSRHSSTGWSGTSGCRPWSRPTCSTRSRRPSRNTGPTLVRTLRPGDARRRARSGAQSGEDLDRGEILTTIDVRPYGYQSEVLADLAAERGAARPVAQPGRDGHRDRQNYCVGARLPAAASRGHGRLAAVRGLTKEILGQSREVFRQVMRTGRPVNCWSTGNARTEWRHVFA